MPRSKSPNKINFIKEALLHEAVFRNDLSEGIYITHNIVFCNAQLTVGYYVVNYENEMVREKEE